MLNARTSGPGTGYQYNLPETLSSDERAEILKEWQKEYIGEGQMFYYYKRLGLPIPNATAGGDAAFILPLPKNEVEMGGREDYKNDK